MDSASKRATAQVKGAFAAPQTAVEAQLPAIEQLYTTLLQGLNQQVDTSIEDTLQSALLRGVARPGLEADLMATIGGAGDLERARLAFQQTADVAGAQRSIGGFQQSRIGAISDLANALQQRTLTERQAKFNRRQQTREYRQKIQQMDRTAELQQIAAAQAASGGGYDSNGDGVPDQATPQQDNWTIADSLLKKGAGKDGHVNPDTYYDVLHEWQAAGGSRAEFNKRFAKYRNKADARKGYYKGKGFPARKVTAKDIVASARRGI